LFTLKRYYKLSYIYTSRHSLSAAQVTYIGQRSFQNHACVRLSRRKSVSAT